MTAVATTGKRRHLTDVEVIAAGEMAQSGTTMEKVAEHFRVSRRTLDRRFKEKGISPRTDPAKAKAAAENAAIAARAALMGDPIERLKDIKDCKDSFRKAFMFIQRVAVKTTMDQVRANAPLSTKISEMKFLHGLAQTLRLAQDGAHKSLGLDKEDADELATLPQLIIQVMGDKELKELAVEREGLGDDLGVGLPALSDADLAMPGENEDDDGIVVEGEPGGPT